MHVTSRNTVHRAAVAALVLVIIDAGSLKGQPGSWQLVGGIGGIAGQSLAHRPVFVAALGRDVATLSRFLLGAELTMGRLPTGHLVCLAAATAGNCDLRELDHFGAISITGAISVPAGIVTPYVRANMGAWLGRDTGATGDQSSRETGFAIAGEAGMRLRHVAAALRLDQLNGARRARLRISSIVVRINF